jgi:hypothetical protein
MVNGQRATIRSNDEETLTLMYTFPVTGPETAQNTVTVISRVEVTVKTPVTGETPDTTATGIGNFTVGSVTWSPNQNPFRANTRYSAQVTLTADENHTFTGLSNTNVTINGQRATVRSNNGTTLTIMFTFPAT